jgi:hypothetical protein
VYVKGSLAILQPNQCPRAFSTKKKKENQCAGDLVGVRTWLIIAVHKQM